MTILALLFDFDGVVWDSETAAFESWREAFAEFALGFSIERFSTILGTIGGPDLLDDLEGLVGRPIDRADVGARRWERKLARLSRLGPMPGVEDYLVGARDRGLAAAIVSTDDDAWIEGGLTTVGLAGRFDFVECANGDLARAKPLPVLYRAALERLGLQANEAVAIEDSPNGIRSAKDAGLFTLAIANTVTSRLDQRAADLVVGSLEELPLDELLAAAETAAGHVGDPR